MNEKERDYLIKEANKVIRERYRMLGNDTFQLIHLWAILEALKRRGYKVIKE